MAGAFRLIQSLPCGCKLDIHTETTAYSEKQVVYCLHHWSLALVEYAVERAYGEAFRQLEDLNERVDRIIQQRLS